MASSLTLPRASELCSSFSRTRPLLKPRVHRIRSTGPLARSRNFLPLSTRLYLKIFPPSMRGFFGWGLIMTLPGFGCARTADCGTRRAPARQPVNNRQRK